MSYTIPIYTLEDPDFHLDIAMRYSTEGFKPFQPSGFYGQDWTLMAGGCISRTVQGQADDQRLLVADHDSIWGFSRAIQNGNIPNKDAVFNLADSVCDTCGVLYFPDLWIPCGRNKVDYLPDIFQFNFCGYKGRFIINNTGKAKIISGDFVKIDISKMQDTYESNAASTASTPNNGSKISIRTIDGYTYVFGGNTGALEYSVLTKRNGSLTPQNSPAVSAWHLTKIIAPNGRTLSFTYVSTPLNTPNYLQSFCTEYDWSEQTVNDDNTHIVYSLHKECLLQSIATSDSAHIEVRFHSGQETNRMYEDTHFTYCVPHYQLDSIVVSYSGEKLRTAHFSYQYQKYKTFEFNSTTDYYWRYLRQVHISGVGTYTMRYNFFEPVYKVDDPNITSPLYWFPHLFPQSDAVYKKIADRFGFWKATSLQGLLSEIRLPTGGKLKFTYGPHEFGEERRFRVTGTQDVELYTLSCANQQIGGARIEKIETYADDSTLVESKNFSYNKKETGNSSGIYYNIYEIFYPSSPNEGYQIVNPYNYGLVDSHIGYSYVEQVTTINADSYRNTYTFDTGRNSYSSSGNNLIHPAAAYDSVELRSGSLTFDGWLIAPGKLLKNELYSGNALTKSAQFKYNGVSETSFGPLSFGASSLGCLDTIICLSKHSMLVARKLLVCPDVVEQVITKEYGSDGQLMTLSTDYTYDSKLRKRIITTTDSRSIPHFTRYTYPDDMHINIHFYNDSPLRMLTQAYRINTPIECVSGYVKDSNEYITAGTINLYAIGQYMELDPNIFPSSSLPPILPDSSMLDSIFVPEPIGTLERYPYLYKTMSLAMTCPITDYQPMTANNADINYDSRYRLSCEYNFDWMYRPVFIKPFGKTATTYTWNGIYPVTKTIGNQTWSYTYKPYIGVSSMTDTRGITIYYTYDSSGRLIEEYQLIDGQKQILNVYQYHNKTE